MTMLQSVIFTILSAFTEILPIGNDAHHFIISKLCGWELPTGALKGATLLGVIISLFFKNFHDWMSILSNFVQIVIYRKKPTSLDERLLLFIAIGILPWFTLKYFFHYEWPPFTFFILTVLSGLFTLFLETRNRRNKGMFDWSWSNSFIAGLFQMTMIIPGIDRSISSLWGGATRNLNRESILKFALYMTLPILIIQAVPLFADFSFYNHEPMSDVTWLTWAVSLIVGIVSSWMAIGLAQKHLIKQDLRAIMHYRIIIGLVSMGVYFWK